MAASSQRIRTEKSSEGKLSRDTALFDDKAICSRFGIDFNHLSAVEDNDNSGLDISRIPFEDIDGQPNVIDLGLEEDFVSPRRVPAATTHVQEIRSDDTCCPKAASNIPVASNTVHDVISTDECVPIKRVKKNPMFD